MVRILHITPHMGGGAGNVIYRLASAGDSGSLHKIFLLEQPVNNHFVSLAQDSGVQVSFKPDRDELCKAMLASDIVVLHWWHHPKTAELLYTFPDIPVRLVIWTHISNLTVPALSPDILLEATRVLFTTESSYNAYCSFLPDEKMLERKTGVVPGSGGLDAFTKPDRKPHNSFNIGYLGFIDFSKLHPDFVSYCKAVNIPEARFILAGDAPAKDTIIRQAEEKGMSNPLDFLGYVTDVPNILSEFDVLGCPLAPYHTCTTENAILEAMASEVPPVLINQLTEKFIIEDKKTGLLVSDVEDYGNAMKYLHENPDKRYEMGKNARKYVINKYMYKNILEAFFVNCEAALSEPKRVMQFKGIMGSTPAEWFVSCLGKDKALFEISMRAGIGYQTEDIKNGILKCSPLLKGRRKSSILHYESEFPDDLMLRLWADIIREENDVI